MSQETIQKNAGGVLAWAWWTALVGAGGMILLLTLMRWIPGGWTVADHLRYGLLGVALVLALLAARARNWPALAPLVLSILINGVMIAPTLVPAPMPAGAGQGGEVRLIHANVWVRNNDLTRLVAQVDDGNADILVVIERFAFNGTDWMAPFQQRLPHMAGCAEADCGSNVFSRWPMRRLGIVTSQWHDAEDIPSFMAVRVLRPDGPFTLVVAHFSQPFSVAEHAGQARWLADKLRELPSPVILTGDFNAAPWSTAIQTIIRDGGVVRLSNTGPTWPTWVRPIGVPIDHVLAGPDVGARDVHVLGDIGSDHRPVAVTLLLPKAE